MLKQIGGRWNKSLQYFITQWTSGRFAALFALVLKDSVDKMWLRDPARKYSSLRLFVAAA